MNKCIKSIKNLLIVFLFMTFSWSVQANDTWLDWYNKGMFSFNNSVSNTFTGITNLLPSLPSGLRNGIHNFGVTWIGEPLNIGAHLIAGRTSDAGIALQRIVVNIYRGWFGFVDRAAQDGVVTTPIDYGLALCTRGVPAGPFIVVPLTGIRTVRDFAADWVAAHVVVYSLVFGVFGLPISLETLVAVELIEELLTLSIAGELGEMPKEAQVNDLAIAQQNYLAGRKRSCTELSNHHSIPK